MNSIIKAGLVLPTILATLMACGSGRDLNSNDIDSNSALAGEWKGRCITTNARDGSKIREDTNTTIRFTRDGQYSRSSTGHHGGEVVGSYTASDRTITVTSDGVPVEMEYSIKGDTLSTRIEVFVAGVNATSNCELQKSTER